MMMEKNVASKKRFFYLVPIAFITYSLAYFDRANYSFGAAGGMAGDLNITAGVASFLSALFFLGYFFFQIPGAIYAERKSAKKLVFWSMILWGFFGFSNRFSSPCGMAISNSFLSWCCRICRYAGDACIFK